MKKARAVDQVNYSVLTKPIELAIDSTGLRPNIDNSFGQVDSTERIVSVKSIRPSPSGRNFVPAGVSGEYVHRVMVNGLPVLDFNGLQYLSNNGGSATWNFMSFNATFANLKWTVHMLCKIGSGSQPGVLIPFLGNNAGSSGAKGFSIFYDDRSGILTNGLTHQITKGTAGVISTSSDNSQITGNEWAVYTFTFDGSLAANLRFKAYKNKTQLTTTVTSASTAVVTGPTNDLQIFTIGNGTIPGVGQVSHVIIQSGVETSTVQNLFIDSLIPYKDALNSTSREYPNTYNTYKDASNEYYLSTYVCQNPVTPDVMVRVYRGGVGGHIPGVTSDIFIQKSIDRGLTWETPRRSFYNPGDPLVVGDVVADYDSNGRLWVFTRLHTFGATDLLPFYAKVLYSDDNGDTAPTVTDITSSMPADGLDLWSFWGHIIQTHTGRLMISFYKTNTTTTSSANYIFYSDNGGSSWSTATIRAAAGTYINEADIIEVNSGSTYRIITVARNDATNEWVVSSSTDDGLTWSAYSNITFGESFTVSCPVIFSKFTLKGSVVVSVSYTNRLNATGPLTAVYGKGTALAIDPTDWDLGTKTIIKNDYLHYGTWVHPYGNLYSIGLYAKEPDTNLATGGNILQGVFGGTIQKQLIITELGL